MTQSTAHAAPRKAAIGILEKPAKPYPEYPLTAHNRGYWCKKIDGTTHYFGRWCERIDGQHVRVENDGWQAALDEYKRQVDDLRAGRTPKPKEEEQPKGLTAAELCDRFAVAKAEDRDAGELSARTWQTYKSTTDRIVRVFGKERLVAELSTDDFDRLRKDIAKTRGPVARGTEIQRVRTVFRYAHEEHLIDRPVQFGNRFKKPPKSVLRKARKAKGKRMLEPEELRSLIDAAPPSLRAMLLLALNCGLGNTDCSSLPESALRPGARLDRLSPRKDRRRSSREAVVRDDRSVARRARSTSQAEEAGGCRLGVPHEIWPAMGHAQQERHSRRFDHAGIPKAAR